MQKGFIFPSLYIVLGAGVIILALGIAVKVQSSRLESCKAGHKAFVSEVERVAKEQELNNKVRKQKADDELKKLKSVNADLSKRVRDNANSSFVREAGATGIPEVTCYKSDSLDEGLRKFVTGVTELIERGQSAVTDLDNAKRWAQQN